MRLIIINSETFYVLYDNDVQSLINRITHELA